MQTICGLLVWLKITTASIAISNIVQIQLVASRHDTSAFWHRKKSWHAFMLVGQHSETRSSRQARLARHVFRGVATAWTGVDMSAPLFPEVVSEIDANTAHERLNLYTRALLLRRPPWWNKRGSTSTTCSSRRARHDMPFDATSGI